MNWWEENELKRLSKRVEKTITKYGKTTVLKALSQIVCFDHLHSDYLNGEVHEHHHEDNCYEHQDQGSNCEECQEFHQNKHNIVVERKTEDVQITCIDEDKEHS